LSRQRPERFKTFSSGLSDRLLTSVTQSVLASSRSRRIQYTQRWATSATEGAPKMLKRPLSASEGKADVSLRQRLDWLKQAANVAFLCFADDLSVDAFPATRHRRIQRGPA